MNSNVGIWIDHQKAVIVFAAPEHATARTVTSKVGAHPHFAGSQEGGGEKKYEERFDHTLANFYEHVIGELGQPQEIFIFGPGEATRQLEKRLRLHKVLSKTGVEVEAADALTEPQVIAKAKEHFGFER